MLSPLTQTGIALLVILEFLTSTGRGASAPYFDNFDSYPNGNLPANFTGSSANGWSLSNPTGSSGRYGNFLSTNAPKYAYSGLSLDNVAGRNFTISTRFTATTFTLGPFVDASVGLIAFSSDDPNVFPTHCYTLEYVVATGIGSRGVLRATGGRASWFGSTGPSTLFDAGQGFTMRLHGEYVDGTLFLTASLSNGVDAITFYGTDVAPPSGPYFGYWDRLNGTVLHRAELTAAYDDFSVTLGTELVRFGNISTRMNVGSDENAAIGGFVITGTSPKRILIRGVRPSGVGTLPEILADPTLELFGQNGVPIAMNDNWKDTQQSEIEQTGAQPSNDLDAAIVATVAPGAYTAILRGKANTTGVGVVETYDLTPAPESKLGNFSTRGFVGVDNSVMIGGVIALGDTRAPLLIRALGPSLQSSGLNQPLADPLLELHDRNGALLASNDNWRETQQAEIEATGLAPTNDAESAILTDLLPTNYTAIVRGKDGATGVALVEFYHLN